MSISTWPPVNRMAGSGKPDLAFISNNHVHICFLLISTRSPPFKSTIAMSPSFATAKITLGYPLYASDFDPQNNDFLLVGGGGGESRSGVDNKIVSRKTRKDRPTH